MSSRSLKLSAWLSVAVLTLAAVPLAKKMALSGGGDAILIAFSTAVVAGIIILAWLVLRGQVGTLSELTLRDWRSVLLVGALGSGLVSLFGILAMTETSAANRALFQSAYPVATAISARLLLKERLDRLAYVWVGLVCLGLVLMNLEPGAGLSLLSWPFWLLLATLPLIGLSDVIAKRSLDKLTPEVIAFGRATGALLILSLLLPWMDASLKEAGLSVWLWVLLAGTCMGVFAVALYQVFDHTLATLAASLIALAPVLTLGLELSFLELQLGAIQWVGFALVIGAAIMLARRV
mgnify:CR=1 FL=1